MASASSQFPDSRPPSQAPYTVEQFPGMLESLREKSLDELFTLLNDEKTYTSFLHSLEPIQHLDLFLKELVRNLASLAGNTLDQNLQITELKNQCTVIRAELACAEERFNELQRLEREISWIYSFASLLDQLKDSALKVDNDSEVLHHRFISREMGLNEFVRRFKDERMLYHKRILSHIAAKSSV